MLFYTISCVCIMLHLIIMLHYTHYALCYAIACYIIPYHAYALCICCRGESRAPRKPAAPAQGGLQLAVTITSTSTSTSSSSW